MKEGLKLALFFGVVLILSVSFISAFDLWGRITGQPVKSIEDVKLTEIGGTTINAVSSGNETCTDSDGGINYYVSGDITVCTDTSCSSYPDTCINSNLLLEGYCDGNSSANINYTCQYGCSNGACLTNQTSNFDLKTGLNFSMYSAQVGQTVLIGKLVTNLGSVDGYITSSYGSTCLLGGGFPCSAGGGGGVGIPIAAGETKLYYENYTFNQVGTWQINRSYYGRGINNETDSDLTNNLASALFVVTSENQTSNTFSISLFSATDTSATIKVSSGATSETKEVNEGVTKIISGLPVKVISAEEASGYIAAELGFNLDLSIGGINPSFITLNLLDPESGNSQYDFTLISASDTSATIKVTHNGISETKEVTEGGSKLINGVSVYLVSADEDPANNIISADFDVQSFTLDFGEIFSFDDFYLVYSESPNASFLDLILLGDVQIYLLNRTIPINSLLVADSSVTKQDVLDTVSVIAFGRKVIVVYPDSPNISYLYAIEAGNLQVYLRSYVDSHSSAYTLCNDLLPSSQLPGDNLVDALNLCGNWYQTPYVCGDADGDGDSGDILDLTYLINRIFRGGPPSNPPEAMDQNGDGAVNIQDLTYLVNYIFRGSQLPPVCPNPTLEVSSTFGTSSQLSIVQDELLNANVKSEDVEAITGQRVPFFKALFSDIF